VIDRRLLVAALSALWLSGCPGASKRAPSKRPTGSPANAEIDFSRWASWVRVTPERLWSRAHDKRYVVVYVSPEHANAYLAGGAMPVGARVVKAIYTGPRTPKPLALHAMAKRKRGYDDDDHDWYYAALTPDGNRAHVQGRVDLCINCHIQAEDADYLFRPTGKGRWDDGWKQPPARFRRRAGPR
jgi:hypothetical protein